MKIEYETTVRHNNGPCGASHKIVNMAVCCGRMKKLLDTSNRFVVVDPVHQHYEEWIGDCNLAVVCLDFVDMSYGEIDHNEFPISFCPFCGVAVTATEVKRTNLYKKATTRTITEEVWEERK